MPFVRGGGIFVPGVMRELGEEVFLLLTLPHDEAKIPLRGTVAWINPEHASGGRPQGIGISLEGDASAQEIGQYVERMLASVANSTRPTHTL